MGIDGRISALIGDIYEGAHEDALWESVLARLLDYTASRFVHVSAVDTVRQTYAATRFYGPDSSDFLTGNEEYAAGLFHSDPTLAWATRHPTARFCDSRVTLPTSSYLDHPFVRWSNSRFGATHWLVGYTAPDDGLQLGVSLGPPASTGPLSARDDQLFRMLFEHMDRAIRLAARPPAFASGADPLVLVDRFGAVQQVSDAARLILTSNDGLAIESGRLRASNSAGTGRLEAAIGAALGALQSGTHGASVRLPRPSGKRDLLVVVSPLIGPSAPCAAFRPAALVRLVEQEQAPRAPRHLAELFGLSEREAEVARMLLAGHSPESLAAALGISVNTAKVHLHALFRKTQTSRQSELMRLLLSLS